MINFKKEEVKQKQNEEEDDMIGDSIDFMMGTGVKFDVSIDIAR